MTASHILCLTLSLVAAQSVISHEPSQQKELRVMHICVYTHHPIDNKVILMINTICNEIVLQSCVQWVSANNRHKDIQCDYNVLYLSVLYCCSHSDGSRTSCLGEVP